MCCLRAVLLLGTLSFINCQDDPLLVKTSQGILKGSVMTSWKGNSIRAFRGIRYAQPPVGQLRFQPPVPVVPWNGTYDATKDGPFCPQTSELSPQSEDCLFLNVYAPGEKISGKKAVVVFMHPGAFAFMGGSSEWYGPDYLLDQDIILVTFNYRLSTLGLLSTEDGVASGNYALKDQVAVLRWVRDNIEEFGGDSGSVTIAGYSAGGGSVILHMISPMSRGLFHRAVAMSGSAASDWAFNENPLSVAKKVANFVNCSTTTTQEMVKCLRNVPAKEISDVFPKLYEWGLDTNSLQGPVLEVDVGDNSERFLVKDPLQSLQEGDFVDVPLIIGTTRDEFDYRALSIFENSTWVDDLSERWNEVAPIIFFYHGNATVSQGLREGYNVTNPLTNESLPAISHLYSDGVIIYGSQLATKLIAAKNKSPVYAYQYTFLGSRGHVKKPGTDELYGVVHHDDLLYLFYGPGSPFTPRFNTTGRDADNVERLTTLYGNFIKMGNPTPEKNEVLDNIIWNPYSQNSPNYLEMGSTLVNHPDGLYYKERMAVWERLFPIQPTEKTNRGNGDHPLPGSHI